MNSPSSEAISTSGPRTAETGKELYRIEAGSTTPTLIADINPGLWLVSAL